MDFSWSTYPIPNPASDGLLLRSYTMGEYPFALRNRASAGPAIPAPMTPTLVGSIGDSCASCVSSVRKGNNHDGNILTDRLVGTFIYTA